MTCIRSASSVSSPLGDRVWGGGGGARSIPRGTQEHGVEHGTEINVECLTESACEGAAAGLIEG